VKIGGKCLMDTDQLPLTGTTFYVPPPGIERRGAIGSQARRRVYHVDRNLVEDVSLGKRLAWDGKSLTELLVDVTDQNLRKNAHNVLTG
jgi:hypothetical protein